MAKPAVVILCSNVFLGGEKPDEHLLRARWIELIQQQEQARQR